MEISQKGIEFIKSYEGCRLHPYLDAGSVPTIGWGFTYYPDGTHVKMTDKPLTQEEADTMFVSIVKPYSDGVIEACGAILQSQLDSLTSFSYNCGLGAFKQSTLLQHIKSDTVTEADFTLYDHVGKEVNQGLLTRRKAEYQLYISQKVEPLSNLTTNNTMDITPETLQVLAIKNITVTYDRSINGEVTDAGRTVDVAVTPELLTALKTSNLVEPNYNIILE